MGDQETKKQLQMMSESELMSLHAEIGSEMAKIGKKLSRKRGIMQLIKNELDNRSAERKATGGFLVSDHAIVRYLERHKNIDIEGIRREIFEMAKAGRQLKDSDRFQNGTAILAINQDRRHISTILNSEENDLVTE